MVAMLGISAALLGWAFFGGMPEAEDAAAAGKARKAKTERAEEDAGSAAAGRRGMRSAEGGDSGRVASMRARLLSREPLGDIDLWDVVQDMSLDELRQIFAEPDLFELKFGAGAPGDAEDGLLPGPEHPRRVELVPILWERLGLLSPQEALDLAKERLKGTDRQHYGALLKGVAKTDPALALKFLGQSSAVFGEDYVLVGRNTVDLFGVLTESSPRKALGVIPDLISVSQDSAYLGYVQALPAETDWAAEIARAESLGIAPSHEGFGGLMDSTAALVTRWAHKDPDAAFAWMAGALADSGPSGYSVVIHDWIREDAEKALPWLEAWQPEGRDKGGIFMSVIYEDSMRDLAATDRVLAMIADPEKRDAAVMQRLASNVPRLPGPALAHLINSPLISEEVRQAANAVMAGERVLMPGEEEEAAEAEEGVLPPTPLPDLR